MKQAAAKRVGIDVDRAGDNFNSPISDMDLLIVNIGVQTRFRKRWQRIWTKHWQGAAAHQQQVDDMDARVPLGRIIVRDNSGEDHLLDSSNWWSPSQLNHNWNHHVWRCKGRQWNQYRVACWRHRQGVFCCKASSLQPHRSVCLSECPRQSVPSCKLEAQMSTMFFCLEVLQS